MCAVKGDDYKHSALDTVLDDLSDVIFYVDFKGIFDRSDSNPRIATRQKKAESMFRPEGIFLDFGNGEAQYFAFERSASMSRNARLAFIRADVYGKVHSRMTLDMQIGDCQLSKLYAYNGLMFSSGTRIEAPNLWKHHFFQIRMPYIKGMVHEMDSRKMLLGAGITMIKDIWG